ncbi:MAG: ABC transporter permease [Melioribacteraceae bacterium]|nr:ABC transporter permease [Melioribacteraceae bacterium]
MFSLDKTITVIKRELKDKLLSKTFVLMTLLLPIFMFGILGFQTFLLTRDTDEGTKIEVVAENQDLLENIRSSFLERTFIKNNYYQVAYSQKNRAEFDEFLDEKRPELLSGNLTGIIYLPNSSLENKEAEYYSKNPNNQALFDKVRGMVNNALVNTYFKDRNLSPEEVKFAGLRAGFNTYRISEGKEAEEEGYGNLIASFLFTFLLYFSLIFLGTMMMRAVVEEKTSKIVEVLLSSCSSKDLMTGKILGTGITGVLQMFIWLLPVILVITTSIFTLPQDFNLKISMGMIGYFLINYFLGLLTFLGLFATVGAIFDNEQDAQSGLWPIMMLIMIPFFIAITAQNNPDSALIQVASFVPFSSIIVMPARLTLVDVPFWQLLGAVVINLATFVGIFILAGKIYRVGILRTGKKPSWAEVVKWFKYQY